MKRKVEWHKECLKHRRVSHAALNVDAGLLCIRINRSRSAIDILERQIRRAEEEGKDMFDPERYQPFKGAKYDLK